MLRVMLLLLCLATSASATNDGRDRRIIFHNDSSYTINRIYASNIGRNDWGIDRLGTSYLYPGEAGWVDLDDDTGYCAFDFKIVTAVGILYRESVNVCRITSYCKHSSDF